MQPLRLIAPVACITVGGGLIAYVLGQWGADPWAIGSLVAFLVAGSFVAAILRALT
jgi:hypothetical protein